MGVDNINVINPKGGNMIEESGCSGGEETELKKGPWTPQEDAILTKFVTENGERNWNDLRRRFGLMRCGQSCRRRWFNNLRSTLKKEVFTLEEETKILRLHATYGNRWSLIALHLPGRSDNEIKNYWNVRLRRHVRAGLPIYPPRILREMLTRLIKYQQQQQTLQNDIQISSLPSANQIINPNLSSLQSSSSSEQNPNFNFIPSSTSSFPHQTKMATSSSSNQELIPNLTPADSNHPLLVASLQRHPVENTIEFDNNGVATMPPPLTLNVPFIPHDDFDETQIAPFDMNPIILPKIINDVSLPEMEIPSIQSSFPETTTSSSIVVPEYWSDRNNNGLLEDILRQSTAANFSSSGLPASKEDEEDQSKIVDQSAGGIILMHDDDDPINGNLNNKLVNLEPMDERSSMNVGEGNVFEDSISLMDVEDDLWSWLDFPTNEFEFESAAYNKVSNGNMAAIANQLNTPAETTTDHDPPAAADLSPIADDLDWAWAQQIMAGSPIPFTPFDQDDDWTLGSFT